MDLHFVRSQKTGLMGGVKFVLTAIVDLSDSEKEFVKRFKLSDTLLYERGSERVEAASSTIGLLAARLAQLRVTANDLALGRTFECKDIMEVMALESQLKEAAALFQQMLAAASRFDGEEVIHFG